MARSGWCAAVVGCLLALGCGGPEQGGDEMGQASGAVCASGSSLTYANFGRPFMEKYCTGCHSSAVAGSARQGAPSDHNFDTLEAIRAMPEHIDMMAAGGPDHVNMQMPPSGPMPTEQERRQLGEWLACGMP